MYKNELKRVPQEIIYKMLERQVEQGNKRDADVFDENIIYGYFGGGFTWDQTIEGQKFWKEVLKEKRYDLFFLRYPKKSYPKIMKVWFGNEDSAKPRVVFMEKNGKYLSWHNAETFEEA